MKAFRIGMGFMAALVALQPQLYAQDPQQLPQGGAGLPAQGAPGEQTPPGQEPKPPENPMGQVRANYVLAPNDQILIRAFNVEEIGERPYRIDPDGNVDLPLVGMVKAGGLSVDQFEADLAKRLSTYVRNPQVSVTVVQYHAEPVFFVGLFRSPGVYTLQGKRTLVEMLASIGGLAPNAARRLTITRRLDYGPLPLPNAKIDKASNTSTAEISMASLRNSINPVEDIVLQPYDQISVARAEMVFIGGEVNHPTGVELGERDSLSVIQLISIAGGLTRDAKLDQARVLRPIMDTNRRAEIPLNLKDVLDGKASDFPLMPNDLLYVPRTKSFWNGSGKYLTVIIPALITTLIYAAIRL